MTVATLPTTIEPEIYYPDTDGKPMAESDFQRQPLLYLIQALEWYFESDLNVYVSGCSLIYYQKGNPNIRVAPDVFVIFGVKKKRRYNYKLWEEGKTPNMVIEVTSLATQQEDNEEKRSLYQNWGVKEYFLYDPIEDYLDPTLQGYCLNAEGKYEQMIGKWHAARDLFILESHVLGLELHQSSEKLRLFNPKTEEYIDSFSEQAKAHKALARRAKIQTQRAEALRADAEAKARAKAEAENARLRALLASLRIDQSAE